MSVLTKAPAEIILDMIKATHAGDAKVAGLTTQLVTFGLPTAASGQNPTRNTQLTVSSVEGSGYAGDVVITYNRLTFDQVVKTKDKVFTLGDATKVSDLVAEINARYNIALTADDYVDADLPAFTGEANEKHTFNLTANADSLIFIGSIELTVKGENIALSDVITTTEMNGLTPPEDDVQPQ